MEHVDFMFLGSSGNSPCQSRQAAVEPRNTNALRRPEERPPRAPASYRFTASAPSRINESWVFHVFRLLGRSVDFCMTYPPRVGLMELMFLICSCVSASRAFRGLMV